jgi:glycosyltransferase involved in cell wall biosynthesis
MLQIRFADPLATLPTARPTYPQPQARPQAGPRLRVCMLAACPFPANHGTPGSIREMAEAITEEGHDVHIVTYHFGEDIPVRGPRLHRITPLTGETEVVVGPTSRRPLYDLQMVFKTLEVIRKYRPHVLHAHGYEAALGAWLCRLATGLPIVYSGHNTMADELPSYRFIRPQWLARALARFLDAWVPRLGTRCLPHSSNIEAFFHGMGLRGRTEPVVNFGIDVDSMMHGDGRAIRRRYGLDPGPVIVYSGVLDEFQRLDLLLEAIAFLVPQAPWAKLLIVVTIPNECHLAAIRRRIEELRIGEHVVLTEPQPLAAVRHFLAAADVAVVPRPGAPGFPIKMLNYMAASRPCVMFASSASRGIRDGENAMLAAPDTGPALGSAILELLGNRELRERVARGGHRLVRRDYDRRVIARRVCATYYRTLESSGRVYRPQRPSPVPDYSSLAPPWSLREQPHGNGAAKGVGSVPERNGETVVAHAVNDFRPTGERRNRQAPSPLAGEGWG